MALHDPNRKFDFAADGLPTSGGRQPHLRRLVVRDKAQAAAPEMKGDGTTVVLLPYPNFDNPNYVAEGDVLPDRNTEGYNDFTRWLFYSPDKGVIRFGRVPVSLLFDNPSDKGFVPEEDHPINLIYKSVFNTVSKNILVETPVGSSVSDDWDLLINGRKSESKFEVIKRPDFIYASYAFICRSGDKAENNFIATGPPLGAGAEDLPVILFMLKSTVSDLAKLLNKPQRNDDPNSPLLYSHVTGDKFVHFYDKKNGSCEAMRGSMAANRPVGGLGGSRPRGPVPGANDDKAGFGYGVHISETFNGQAGGLTFNRTEVAKFACSKLRPWHETLAGHTPAQCADVVERVCGLPPSVLYHAWKTRPEYYSETLKASFANRQTFLPQTQQSPPPQRSGLMPSGGTSPTLTQDAGGMPDSSREAPWGGRTDDPPLAGSQPTPNPTSNQATLESVRDRFRSKFAAEAGIGSVSAKPAAPPTFAPPTSE